MLFKSVVISWFLCVSMKEKNKLGNKTWGATLCSSVVYGERHSSLGLWTLGWQSNPYVRIPVYKKFRLHCGALRRGTTTPKGNNGPGNWSGAALRLWAYCGSLHLLDWLYKSTRYKRGWQQQSRRRKKKYKTLPTSISNSLLALFYFFPTKNKGDTQKRENCRRMKIDFCNFDSHLLL